MQIEEDLIYRPKTRDTKAVYEQLLALVQNKMGDCSLEIIKGALDEILAIIKSETNSAALSKKAEIESLVDQLSE